MSFESSTPFELLIAYLQGETDAGKLHAAFTKGTSTKDAFNIYKNTDKPTPTQERQLCTLLDLPQNTTFPPAENLLDTIDNLNKNGYGYGQLADFRHIIKHIKPKYDWSGPMLFTTLVTASISTIFFLNPKQIERLEGALKLLAPFLGPFFLIGYQSYSLYRQARNTLNEDTYYETKHRFRRWLVGTLPPVLNLSAYAVLAVAGTMTPLGAALFITASLIDVVDGLFRFYRPSSFGQACEPGSMSELRKENRDKRTYQTLLIKWYSAVALAAAVAVSCILPPTLFVLLSCGALFVLIPLTKTIWLNKTHAHSSNALQEALNQYTTDHTPEQSTYESIPDVPPITLESNATRLAAIEDKIDTQTALLTELQQASMFRPLQETKSIATQTDVQEEKTEELSSDLAANFS